MQGTPGVSLLVTGCVVLVVLAAPGVLMASEEPVAPPVEPTQPATPEPGDGVTPPEQGDEGTTPEQLEPVTNSAKGGTQAAARAAATRNVAMRNIKFNPRNITIDPGDTVRWENDDSERHNAIGEDGKFETPIISQGESSQHTFNSPGKIDYFCSLHANMDGTITVRGSGGAGGGGSGGGGGGSGGTGNGTGVAGGSTAGSTGSTGSTGGAFTPSGGSATGGSSSSSLPATGEDLPWLALLGYGVLALGALLRLFVFSRE